MTTPLVVDASVVPKWFFPEPQAEFAARLRFGYQLIAPEFLLLELANVLVQKTRRSELNADDAAEILQRAVSLPVELVDDVPHLGLALELASRHHPSAYDCLYAAVARVRECKVVTADREFYQALRETYPETMLWIEDIPEPGAPERDPGQQ